MAAREFEYDVCLSFAGEDREYVEQVANLLAASDVTVFYDRYEQTDLWGKDLYTHLDEVYRSRARFCVMFVSEHYEKKLWTNHERRSAQARAFRESGEYILPARFDDTEIPGLLPTVGHISLQGMTPAAFAALIKSKLTSSDGSQPGWPTGEPFRRIYYESFARDHMTREAIKNELGGLWLVGKKGHWQGRVSGGMYRLRNVSGPDACLHNTIRYFEPDDHPVDLGDCRVSVRVRVGPPNDAHSGAGLLFRAAPRGESYYSFLLQPGNCATLAETRSGKMTVLWTQEIPEVRPDAFVTLKVFGQGPRILFFVNESLIQVLPNASLLCGNPGVVGLSIGNFEFTGFTIYIRQVATQSD